jgi:hypothetical protein
MLMITKRSGREEEFRPEKIQKSMRNAGVSHANAVKIASGINYREGMTTGQVRNRVIGGINQHEPDASDSFEGHPRKPHQK